MPAPNSSTYRMADRLADGHLAEVITSARAEGLSLDRIMGRLAANHGIEVSRPTVGNWIAELEAGTEPVAS